MSVLELLPLDTQARIADARELECKWGVLAAVGMLTDGLITPADCLALCEEAAEATTER